MKSSNEMYGGSFSRPTLASRLMAGAMLVAMAGLAARACPPEEARASGDDVVAFEGAMPEGVVLIGDESPILPRMSGQWSGTSRATIYNFKWTGKDAGSQAKEVEAEYKDGSWKVKVDGKDVPSERFSTENSELVVKDDAGKEIFRAPVQVEAPARAYVPRVGTLNLIGPRGGLFSGQSASRPRLGVTMNAADDVVIEHLGLAEGEYAEISSVTPGSAAEEAGLKAKDVVVSVDGRTPASTEVVREVIAGKGAGDKIKLKVIRKGQPMEIEATLKKTADAEVPEVQSMPGAMALPEGQAKLSELSDRLALIDKDMAKRAEELAKAGAEQGQKWKELTEKYGQLQGRFPGDGQGMKFAVPIGPNGERRQIEVFSVPGEREKLLDERLKLLEERLKVLEDVLKRVDARLGGVPVPPAAPVPPAVPVPPAAPPTMGQ